MRNRLISLESRLKSDDDNFVFYVSFFIILWANSADEKLIILIFPRKQNLTFHANSNLHKIQNLFSGKNKNISAE